MSKYQIIYRLIVILIPAFLVVSCTEKEITEDEAYSFLKYFGTGLLDEGTSITQLKDGGYAVLATMHTVEWEKEMALILLDRYGNLKQPIKYFGNNQDDIAVKIIPASDGGFYLAGNTYSATGLIDVMLSRTDSIGNILTGWPVIYGKDNTYNDIIADIVYNPVSDQLAIAGTVKDPSAEGSAFLFAIFSPDDGSLVLENRESGKGENQAYTLALADDAYILAGKKREENSTKDLVSIKVYRRNGIDKSKIYTLPGNSSGVSLIHNGNNRYYLACTNELSEASSKVTLFSFDYVYGEGFTDHWGEEGKSFEFGDRNDPVQILSESDYIYTLFNSQTSAPANTVILKTNLEGTDEQFFEFGEGVTFSGNGFEILSDKSFIITGKNEITSDNKSVYVLKLDQSLSLQ